MSCALAAAASSPSRSRATRHRRHTVTGQWAACMRDRAGMKCTHAPRTADRLAAQHPPDRSSDAGLGGLVGKQLPELGRCLRPPETIRYRRIHHLEPRQSRPPPGGVQCSSTRHPKQQTIRHPSTRVLPARGDLRRPSAAYAAPPHTGHAPRRGAAERASARSSPRIPGLFGLLGCPAPRPAAGF